MANYDNLTNLYNVKGQAPPNSASSVQYGDQYQTGWWSRFTGGDVEKAANVAMAEINRRYQASEAQKNRDWQQMMSNSAYQRQVADMKAAGINPALLFAGKGNMSGASTPSGASGSGAQANNPASSTGQLTGLLASIIGSTAFAVTKGFSAASSLKGKLFNSSSQLSNHQMRVVKAAKDARLRRKFL